MSLRVKSSTTPRPTKPRQSALVPAAARAATTLSLAELDLSGAAIETFTKAVGGREKLLSTLAIADTTAHADKVVNLLLDPTYNGWSIRRLCHHAGITVADLFASYKRALFMQASIDAAYRITSQLPPIIDDVMRRAIPQPIVCKRCFGAPTTPDTSPCPECQGSGTTGYTEPDLDRQKLALELGHLIEKRAGLVVNQNAIAAGSTALASTAPGSLEQLQQAVGDLLFAPGRRRAASPGGTIDVSPSTPQEAAP